jgi:hypothetical protein
MYQWRLAGQWSGEVSDLVSAADPAGISEFFSKNSRRGPVFAGLRILKFTLLDTLSAYMKKQAFVSISNALP